MNVGHEELKTIHLSELDEYLASRLLDNVAPLRFTMSREDFQGYITIGQEKTEMTIEAGGIDFELSPSEYQSLDSINISDFTNQTIYTSSAYEFFDFMLMYFSRLEYLLDFNNSSWRIRILSFKEDK
ncbi:MAG: hypothetical protein E4H21_05835 [Thermodesulfobacteriales bacterium]|nr:MAG: hypothetical protein E4H21_05835 [Thermodesulfobacteriales bacterium]